jgi:HAE1 family hydrophobic/amphiphilic exporter-1
MLRYVNLYSTDAGADETFLYDFANVHVIAELQRIHGIGRVTFLGNRRYAMRVWLKPDRMRAYGIATEDVMTAIGEQSVIGRPGRTGQSSGRSPQSTEYVLTYVGRYADPAQYGDIILRATPDGRVLRLRDVADVELGCEFQSIYSNLDGRPSAAIVVKQNPGSNAREVIGEVKARLEELRAKTFPPGMQYSVAYDVSAFLDASIDHVVHTLGEAFVLVALVVFLFLGDWRSTLIPTIAVPVSLIGAFVGMQAFDLTINLITLFALVLAIGVVVDDAIVVVEAVHVKMAEAHVGPYDAVRRVLGEISGAIIAITLMMSAVFVPLAFMTGPVGVLFRQFAITMASAIVLSGVVALTLTPVLCAMILRPHEPGRRPRTPIGMFLRWFDRTFEAATARYERVVRSIVTRRVLTFGILLCFGVGIAAVNEVLPSGFIPAEDQGQIYAIVQTPPGTTLERTNEIMRRLQDIARELPDVESVSSLAGYEILTEGRGSNAGTCLINLRPWSERHLPAHEVVEELEERTRSLGAIVEYFEPPSVPGYGAADGFALRLLDLGEETDYHEFDRVNREFMDRPRERPEPTGLFTFFGANYPQYEVVIDNERAMQKGVSIGRALDDLDILVGST